VCTQLAAACDKVYQLLAHGRWFFPGTLASSTTKTGRHDIAEILLKVALKHQNQIKSIYKNRYTEKTTDLPHVTDDKLDHSIFNMLNTVSIWSVFGKEILYRVHLAIGEIKLDT
jgi:hypothetical protein